jgi:beta-lactamase superfamily II metal-dependent hydrolase
MGYEIDFLPVGNGDSSGDAIAVRWGTKGNYQVMVYDGGTKEAGEALVEHILRHYGTTRVDHVVSSHPDGDHASGLSVVLARLDVQRLWMHRPWMHSALIRNYFADGRMTHASLAARLQDKMRPAYDLEALAHRRSIPIVEPFFGQQIGPFWVLSPDRDWYLHELVPAFEKSPETKARSGLGLRSPRPGIIGALALAANAAVGWLQENWSTESLREDVTTSAENESSVILYGELDGQAVLLTGDAGVQALGRTAASAEFNRLDLPNRLKFVQIPHHGSRHNVSTSTLDRLIGPRLSFSGVQPDRVAYASAGKDSTSHPRKVVMNAFLRRGYQPYATRGMTLRYSHQMPGRDGWGPATPIAFADKVEAWD